VILVLCSDQLKDESCRSIELDFSKPYLPILERSSQLMESVLEESTDRVVIDATPLPLRKRAAKRKRKEDKAEVGFQ